MAKLSAVLKSGEYNQGREALCTTKPSEKEGCCLGIMQMAAGVPFVWDEDHDWWADVFGGVEMPHPEVSKLVGLDVKMDVDELNKLEAYLQTLEYEAYIEVDSGYQRSQVLAQLNDHGAPLTIIADVLIYMGWDFDTNLIKNAYESGELDEIKKDAA